MKIEDSTLSCDGLNCAYRDTISWQGPTSPLPMQNNPQVIFERLFGDGSTDAERRDRRSQHEVGWCNALLLRRPRKRPSRRTRQGYASAVFHVKQFAAANSRSASEAWILKEIQSPPLHRLVGEYLVSVTDRKTRDKGAVPPALVETLMNASRKRACPS